MRKRKKRAQREEVRKILHAMRLELAAQRLAQERDEPEKRPIFHLGEFIKRAYDAR